MELLIISIIMIIISSLFRSLQGAGKSAAPSPAPPRAPFPEGEILQQEMRPGDYPVPRESPPVPCRVKAQSPLPGRKAEERESAATSPPSRTQGRRAPVHGRKKKEQDKMQLEQLVALLSSEKVALGVLTAEVLAAPRSRRPFFKAPR